ncbi:hypothetical protein FACS1894137_04990 [Spirochaetia bacterium]|nr:hypothetical protein FACS1894137_04990 [Spirochaetia bacterium]
MWFYFRQKSEDNGIVVYEYGFESKELTGEVRYNRMTKKAEVIKLAKNDPQMDTTFATHSFVNHHTTNGETEGMVAYG